MVLWNPRYTLYAKSNGRDEKSQSDHDENEGSMMGFSFWIKEKWREFCTQENYCYECRLVWAKEFDIWLQSHY
ncbi:MAG: hypothetical protein RLY43_2155 [Bacteroidota bacterium]|jgi:hypothetical protein